jgi:hypothetical protein
MGFYPRNAINALFYRTQWLNIDRHGRSGISNTVGLGSYKLTNWWHLSTLSSFLYGNAGAVTTLLATLVWSLSHLLWLPLAGGVWTVAITSVILISTISYATAFSRQNYNVLGWMCWPMALLLTDQNSYVVASLTWLASAAFSLTSFVISTPIVLILALIKGEVTTLLVLIPATIYTIVKVVYRTGLNIESITRTARLIGLTHRETKYKRKPKTLSLSSAYFVVLYTLCGLLLISFSGYYSTLPLFLVSWFLINQLLVRFADDQSFLVAISSVFAFIVLRSEPSIFGVLILVIITNPLGSFLLLNNISVKGGVGSIKLAKPYDNTRLVEACSKFMIAVPAGEKILFAFSDPKGQYNNIFDGYRILHELSLYVACRKGIHLFPDWWTVSESNFEGASIFWGRSAAEVHINCCNYDSSYAIIYQDSTTELDKSWDHKFKLISILDWKDYADELNGEELWTGTPPKYFLLQCNKRGESIK